MGIHSLQFLFPLNAHTSLTFRRNSTASFTSISLFIEVFVFVIFDLKTSIINMQILVSTWKTETVNTTLKEFMFYLCYEKTESSIPIVSQVTNIIYEVLNKEITIFTQTEQTSDSALS